MNIDNITIEELKAKNKRLHDEGSKYLSKSVKQEKTIKKLRLQIEEMQDQITTSIAEAKKWERMYDEIYFNRIKGTETKHNERGAGRKQKFTDKEIRTIKELRKDGKTIKEIAKEFKCSVGLIHKLINEKNKIE